MKEYTLSDGTAVSIMDYEEWLWDSFHMTEEEFRAGLDKRPAPLFETKYSSTDYSIKLYRDKYRQYVDRIHLDHMPLTFAEYLESYEGHTQESFHEMCAATGVTVKEESRWLDRIREAWEKHENNIIPF